MYPVSGVSVVSGWLLLRTLTLDEVNLTKPIVCTLRTDHHCGVRRVNGIPVGVGNSVAADSVFLRTLQRPLTASGVKPYQAISADTSNGDSGLAHRRRYIQSGAVEIKGKQGFGDFLRGKCSLEYLERGDRNGTWRHFGRAAC